MRRIADLNRLYTINRLALGLPVRVAKKKKIPWGYERDATDRTLCNPICKHLRALKKAYELHEEGCTWADIKQWIVANTGRNVSIPKLCQLYQERPIFDEIKFHIDERKRFYETPPAQTRPI